MTHQPDTKARIQYSSRDELDIAVICYCRGRSRYDLHARTRLALNSFYGPFAMANCTNSAEILQRQALSSIRQLSNQIAVIQEQFLPERHSSEPVAQAGNRRPPISYDDGQEKTGSNSNPNAVAGTLPDLDLQAFLGEEAALMAGLNPFNDDLM